MNDGFVTNPLFERVERARRRKHKIRETHITLAHGSGGRAMHDLVEGVFLEYFQNPLLDKLEDQAVFEVLFMSYVQFNWRIETVRSVGRGASDTADLFIA